MSDTVVAAMIGACGALLGVAGALIAAVIAGRAVAHQVREQLADGRLAREAELKIRAVERTSELNGARVRLFWIGCKTTPGGGATDELWNVLFRVAEVQGSVAMVRSFLPDDLRDKLDGVLVAFQDLQDVVTRHAAHGQVTQTEIAAVNQRTTEALQVYDNALEQSDWYRKHWARVGGRRE
jgi:hypothetical protein